MAALNKRQCVYHSIAFTKCMSLAPRASAANRAQYPCNGLARWLCTTAKSGNVSLTFARVQAMCALYVERERTNPHSDDDDPCARVAMMVAVWREKNTKSQREVSSSSPFCLSPSRFLFCSNAKRDSPS